MARRRWVTLLVALCLPLHGAALGIGSGLTLKVDPHAEHCAYEDVPQAGDRVFFSFQVTAGGALDLDVVIHGPDNPDLWVVERESEGRAMFKAPAAGKYIFCLSNKMTTLTTKTVQFHLAVGDPALLLVKGKGPKRPDAIARSIVRLEEGLMEIRDEQQYLRTRERVHRDAAEVTNTRVMLWAVLESSMLVVMGLGQVYYLRRCFEVKRRV
eukprot:TRINITY_DN2304_c0_g1_i1.p2 TRINITY_DN2304_c0_g1~~TRINITY_DN2304_c0_g1_i1.p2  ORF type:complete len:218 (+),score=79.71 TRINITY_DN2304_c0_g1_i1:23-655(+)